MKLKVLNSGSKGNCYLLSDDKEVLIIEPGISFKEIKIGLDFNLSKVVGALCSHAHLDHSKAIKDFVKNGIDVYSSQETFVSHQIIGRRTNIIESEKQFKIGGFTILPLEAKHDIHCLSFLIQHEDIGKLFFITDSYYCLYKFNGLNHILIEANYSEKILERNNINETIKERLLKSHFSLENAKKFVKANDNPKLKNIVLLHLSDSNSNAKEFKGVMEELTHKRVEIADKGLEIELNK